MSHTKKRKEESSDEPEPSLQLKSGSPTAASVAETDALSNHVVLKQVLLFLETQDLLELSLVNKLWCSTARSVLRSHRRCLAGIKGEIPCKELLRLDQVLSTSSGSPFSGLALRILGNESERDRRNARPVVNRHSCIDINHDDNVESSVESSEVSLYSAIIEKLTFRYLEMQWEREYICPAENLLRRILKGKRGEFVELKLVQFPKSIVVPLKEYLGIVANSWLPNLKVLDTFSGLYPVLDSVLKRREYELIQAAPQLKEKLGYTIRWDLRFFFETNKSSLIKHFWLFKRDFFGEKEDELDELIRFADSEPKLTKLILDAGWLHSDHNGRPYETVTHFLRRVLHCSASSVENILLYQEMFLDPLPETLVKPLYTLKEMTLGLTSQLDWRLGLPTLERVDWGGFFPQLETLSLFSNSGRSYDRDDPIINSEGWNIEEGLRERLLRQPVSTPCRSVRSLSFTKCFDYDLNQLDYLGRLFPNVKEFSIQTHAVSSIGDNLQYLWTNWPDLEHIRIWGVWNCGIKCNLDARLCGITEEEAVAYRNEPIHTLRCMSLGTTGPSIRSFKRLKKLRIESSHSVLCTDPAEVESCSFLLSHITPILAFREMPGFEMEVVRRRCEAPCVWEVMSFALKGYELEHLRPYVTLVDAD